VPSALLSTFDAKVKLQSGNFRPGHVTARFYGGPITGMNQFAPTAGRIRRIIERGQAAAGHYTNAPNSQPREGMALRMRVVDRCSLERVLLHVVAAGALFLSSFALQGWLQSERAYEVRFVFAALASIDRLLWSIILLWRFVFLFSPRQMRLQESHKIANEHVEVCLAGALSTTKF
jgi:hypothetical protein